MKGVLVEKSYRYQNAVLAANGVEFEGMVYIREGKIYRTDSIQCTLKEGEKVRTFSFTLQRLDARAAGTSQGQSTWEEPSLNISAWPSGVSVNDTVAEFKQFVLADIAE